MNRRLGSLSLLACLVALGGCGEQGTPDVEGKPLNVGYQELVNAGVPPQNITVLSKAGRPLRDRTRNYLICDHDPDGVEPAIPTRLVVGTRCHGGENAGGDPDDFQEGTDSGFNQAAGSDDGAQPTTVTPSVAGQTLEQGYGQLLAAGVAAKKITIVTVAGRTLKQPKGGYNICAHSPSGVYPAAPTTLTVATGPCPGAAGQNAPPPSSAGVPVQPDQDDFEGQEYQDQEYEVED